MLKFLGGDRFFGTWSMPMVLGVLVSMACCNENVLEPPLFMEAFVSEIEPLAHVRSRCLATHGRWNSALVSCLCPPYQLFNVDEGCQVISLSEKALTCSSHFSRMPREKLQPCVRNLVETPTFHVSIDLQSLSDSEVNHVAAQLDKDMTAIVPGVSFATNNKDNFFNLHVQKLDQESFNTNLMRIIQLRGTNPVLMFASPSLTSSPSHFNPDAFLNLCKSKLDAYQDDAKDVKDNENLCDATMDMLKFVFNSDLTRPYESPSVQFTQEGQNCFENCTITASFQRNGYAVRYSVPMKGYVPVMRLIDTMASENSNLLIYISPMGKIEAVILNRYKPGIPTDDFLIKTHRHAFDDEWKFLDSEAEFHGKRYTFQNALKDPRMFDKTPLLTDGKRLPIENPIKGLLIDSGIDVRVPGLLSRVKINRYAVEKYLEDGYFNFNIFSYFRNPTAHAWDMAFGEHGTSVASVIASDLPNIELDFIPGDDLFFKGDNPEVFETWISYIEKSGARVVNISMNFSELVTQCEAFLGRMFQKLPHVLFVIGMGNGGAQNPIICPASIAHAYPNVLTVAGTYEDGSLARPSNYGRDVAMVAAPFIVDSIEVDDSSDPVSIHQLRTGGTSMSAAVVSNAALRLIARYPFLTPSHVMNIFMQMCKKNHMDVACGGEIDFDAVEALHVRL